MKKLSLKNIYDWPLTLRMLILGLLAVIVFYLCYLLDISSLSTNLLNAQQKEREIKDQLQFVITKQAKLANEISQASQLQQLLNQWQNKLIAFPALSSLINEILQIGGANHVIFPLFHPDAGVKAGNFFKVPIKIIAVGNYHQLASFVSQVANLPWIVTINDFTITSEIKNDVIGTKLAEKAAAENLLTANFNFEVYYLADKNSTPKS